MAHILIIDDDPELLALASLSLQAANYDVSVAPDGQQGLKIFREHPADLVITDLFMPNREGLETIRDLRQLSPALRIIAISGEPTADTMLSIAGKLGADALLRKPFLTDELLNTVRKVLASRAGDAKD